MADLFDIAIARKLSGGGGGGGDSDFSTCTVTVSATEGEVNVYLPIAEDEVNMPPFVIPASAYSLIQVNAENDPFDHKVILYKGMAFGYLDEGHSATVTGSIQRSGLTLTITGDGTITIS